MPVELDRRDSSGHSQLPYHPDQPGYHQPHSLTPFRYTDHAHPPFQRPVSPRQPNRKIRNDLVRSVATVNPAFRPGGEWEGDHGMAVLQGAIFSKKARGGLDVAIPEMRRQGAPVDEIPDFPQRVQDMIEFLREDQAKRLGYGSVSDSELWMALDVPGLTKWLNNEGTFVITAPKRELPDDLANRPSLLCRGDCGRPDCEFAVKEVVSE